ncbi:hypothetical protein AAG906_033125 [Vitis piasezkii]
MSYPMTPSYINTSQFNSKQFSNDQSADRKIEGNRESRSESMNWVQRKIYLYNVTFGLYMLDWWERCLFNILVILLMWFVCYNGARNASEFCKSNLWSSDGHIL